MLPETINIIMLSKVASRIQKGIRRIERETKLPLFAALAEGGDVEGFLKELRGTADFTQIIFERSEQYPELFRVFYTDTLDPVFGHYEYGFYVGDVHDEVERYFVNLWTNKICESWNAWISEDLGCAASAEEGIADMLRESEG